MRRADPSKFLVQRMARLMGWHHSPGCGVQEEPTQVPLLTCRHCFEDPSSCALSTYTFSGEKNSPVCGNKNPRVILWLPLKLRLKSSPGTNEQEALQSV